MSAETMERTSLGARLAAAWAIYTEKRLVIILLLGFSSGLPLALTGSTLSGWMRDEGVDLKTIGLFSLVGLPYVLKFIWAPVIDHVRLPFLTRRLGRRRGWLVTTQVALAVSLVLMGLVNPVATPVLMAFAALLVAFCSATQDIVIDAFRVESLPKDEQAAGMANYVAAYRIAMLVSTGGAVSLVAFLQSHGLMRETGWSLGYAAMAALMGVGLIASLLATEPDAADARTEPVGLLRQIRHAVIDPFADFAKKRQWATILAFVVFYKLADAYAGHMLFPFALDIGFDKATYAGISSTAGLAAALAGGFVGGWLVNALGQTRALWIGGIIQTVSNLVFCWLAYMGPDPMALGIAITVENFTGAIGTVVFVGWISSLCTARSFTATQFALLSALAAVGRTFISASTGYVAAAIGWVPFFIFATVTGIPGLLLLWWLGRANAIESGEEATESAGTA